MRVRSGEQFEVLAGKIGCVCEYDFRFATTRD